MPPVTVVVTFYSRGGTTEDLAHAAAVGAVQARAAIRLRRVPDTDPEAALERAGDAREALRRMQKEYIAPREIDVAAADGLIFASPAGVEPSSPEWAAILDLLGRMQAEGKLAGKVAGVVRTVAHEPLADALRRLGLHVVTQEMSDAADDVSRAVALGRQVVSAAVAARIRT